MNAVKQSLTEENLTKTLEHLMQTFGQELLTNVNALEESEQIAIENLTKNNNKRIVEFFSQTKDLIEELNEHFEE